MDETLLNATEANNNEVGQSIEQAVEPVVNEAPKIAETEKDPRLSSRMAYLAKRERMLQEKERSITEKLAKFKQYEQFDQDLEKNPLELLEKKGWDYNKLTQKVLESGGLTLEQKIEMLEKRIADKEQKEIREAEERKISFQRQQESQAIEAYKAQVAQLAQEGADKYDLVNRLNAHDLAFEIAEQYYLKHKQVIPAAMALEEAEKSLEQEYLPKLLESQKLRSRMSAPKAEISDQKAAIGTMTLTNKGTASPSATTERKLKTAEESLAEAARLLKWND